MQVIAPAKINLTLRVLGKRPDGYHTLESVMQMLSLHDVITYDSDDRIVFSCSDPVLENDDNLVVRAAKLLHPYNAVPRGVRMHLDKRIPAQAGLGGGSSDAAATLLALNEFWEIRLPLEKLSTLAARLGSDVPFFLGASAAVVRGRGEEVTPLLHNTVCHVALAKPAAGLSTAAMYAALGAGRLQEAPARLPETQAMTQSLQSGDLIGIATALTNDLAAPAFAALPELRRLCERMTALGALGTLLCGSGSAIFGLFPDEHAAAHAALDLTNDAPWTASAAFCTAHGRC